MVLGIKHKPTVYKSILLYSCCHPYLHFLTHTLQNERKIYTVTKNSLKQKESIQYFNLLKDSNLKEWPPFPRKETSLANMTPPHLLQVRQGYGTAFLSLHSLPEGQEREEEGEVGVQGRPSLKNNHKFNLSGYTREMYTSVPTIYTKSTTAPTFKSQEV